MHRGMHLRKKTPLAQKWQHINTRWTGESTIKELAVVALTQHKDTE